MPSDQRDLLKSSIDNFVNKEQWYLDNNIPYQIGFMFHGKPGNGKTSLVRAVASYMKANIAVLTASQLTFLKEAVLELPSNAILVIEDIDTNSMVHQRSEEEVQSSADNSREIVVTGANGKRVKGKFVEVSAPSPELDEPADSDEKKKDPIQEMIKKSAATFLSDVLNSLDGLFAAHGRVLIITTNHPEKLDAALVRPGRIDVRVEISNANDETFSQYLKRMFGAGWEVPRGYMVKPNTSFATLQNEVRAGKSREDLIRSYIIPMWQEDPHFECHGNADGHHEFHLERNEEVTQSVETELAELGSEVQTRAV